MAHAATGGEPTGGSGRVKLPIPLLLIVVMLGVWLGLAGGGAVAFFLIKSGKLPIAHAADTGSAEKGRSITLEPILVNLADPGGHAYLRVGLTLDVVVGTSSAGPEAGPKDKGPDSEVRDIVLTVLSRQSSGLLLGPDGKEHLKIELREAITKSDLKMTVKDLYFSDFLVQS